jgi:bacillolysin/neutral peptidase B
LEEIADYCEVDRKKLAGVEPPELTFFHVDESETWHLAYHFRKVSAAPKSFLSDAIGKGKGHGLGSSPRRRKPRLDFLVDAHDGEILYYYSSTPLFSMPVKCRGLDELDAVGEFFGQQAGTKFQMDDPLRTIRTFDLKLKDIESVQLPKTPVRHSTSDWRKTNRAAVSAHVNATRVYDFYNGVLMRDGIDGKGMELVSVVNCTYAEDEGPPQWHNAVWYDNRMWYGQDEGSSGKLRSFARFLDVIAHELTHGVTDHTSNLVYRDQSGALNESFSDIFGIIIANWYRVGPDSNVDAWDWELGAGLGENGLPLRDLSDPARTGDPDHMDDYLNTNLDSGGVHTNSNIHNKAAYNVLTAEDRNGKRVFSPRDVAVLYYLTLIRLGMLATFSDALEALSEVAKVYYAGDTTERDKKVKLIQKAYKAVGIE